MSHYKPYPAYKDSGVEWLGRVPEHWQVRKLKWLASLQSGDFITGESIEEEGEYPVYGGNGLRGYCTSFTHEGGYALVGRQGALCGNINYAEGKFWASEHAVVVSPYVPTAVRWLGELLRAMNLGQYSISSAQPGLAVERIIDLFLPVPPEDERQIIAAHVCCETARIDALIEKKTRFIELLREKRQALITHVVTKGLDSHAKMKDSGVEWLGEVPEHWDVGVVSRIATRTVVGIAEAATHAYADSGTPILRSTNIRPYKIIGEILHVNADFADDRDTKLIHAGDLVTVRTGNAGVTAVVPPELEGCQCFTMLITTLKDGMQPDYYCYWMNSAAAIHYFSIEGWGTAQVNISVPILKSFPVPIPPAEAQKRIVDFLHRETQRLDMLLTKTECSIDRLKERRSALITAAVTGQIDLREAV